jgi:hypothetical protein
MSWELIERESSGGELHRRVVPGGYLYREAAWGGGGPTPIALAFVPYPSADIKRFVSENDRMYTALKSLQKMLYDKKVMDQMGVRIRDDLLDKVEEALRG